jgi:hypothetical protein
LISGSFALVAMLLQTVNTPAFRRTDVAGSQRVTTPEFVSYPAPPGQAHIGGTVRVQLQVTDGTIAEARALDGPLLLLEPARLAASRLRVADRVSDFFIVAFKYEVLPSRGCLADQNSTVTIRLPDEVLTQASRPPRIHREAFARLRLKRLAGVVRCDCDKSTAGAVVELASYSNSDLRRTVRADRAGRFVFENLPYGSYQLSIAAPGFLGRHYVIDYSEYGGQNEADFAVALDPCLKIVVEGGQVPYYPSQATAQRLEGEVLLRYDGSSTQATQVSGPAPLARAAMENLRTWRFSAFEAKSLDVKYKYLLRSPECKQFPITHLRLPTEVEVIACVQ